MNYYITNYTYPRSRWVTVLNIGTVLLLVAAAGYTGYVEGYSRGCKDTLQVVEEKADSLVKRLFGG